MKVLVLGASGRVGRAVVTEALAAGHAVIAVARTPAKLSLPPNAALTVVQGDAYDAVSFDAAVATARPDAVISTLGHVKGSPPDLLRVALRNATDACAKHGVRRLVILGGILWARPGDALPLILGAHRERVRQLQGDGRELVAYWVQIPADERRGAGLALEMVKSLLKTGESFTAQGVIEEALEEEWNSELIALYADCQGGDVLGRIAHAEEWLLQQPNDTSLLLTLGRLCIQQQLWGKAQSYLEASLALQPSITANIQLAKLLEQLGHTAEANRLYRAAALLAV